MHTSALICNIPESACWVLVKKITGLINLTYVCLSNNVKSIYKCSENKGPRLGQQASKRGMWKVTFTGFSLSNTHRSKEHASFRSNEQKQVFAAVSEATTCHYKQDKKKYKAQPQNLCQTEGCETLKIHHETLDHVNGLISLIKPLVPKPGHYFTDN